MRGLGYERYGAGGSDWGAAVTTYMALDDPTPLLGIHLSNLDTRRHRPGRRLTRRPSARSSAATAHWDATERGYSFQPGHRARRRSPTG